MRPQDYPNVLKIDADLLALHCEIQSLDFDSEQCIELKREYRELLAKRHKQVEFNALNETERKD